MVRHTRHILVQHWSKDEHKPIYVHNADTFLTNRNFKEIEEKLIGITGAKNMLTYSLQTILIIHMLKKMQNIF